MNMWRELFSKISKIIGQFGQMGWINCGVFGKVVLEGCVSWPLAVSIYTRILKYRVWKIEFEELDFLSISNSNFSGYTGSKNLVQTIQKFQFIKLDFSNSIFQNPCADRYRNWLIKDTLKWSWRWAFFLLS